MSIGDETSPAIQALEPLLGLHQLQSFELQYSGTWPTTNDIQTMALAWPNLTEFVFEASGYHSCGFVFDFIISIARHFPKLQVLETFLIDDHDLSDYSQW